MNEEQEVKNKFLQVFQLSKSLLNEIDEALRDLKLPEELVLYFRVIKIFIRQLMEAMKRKCHFNLIEESDLKNDELLNTNCSNLSFYEKYGWIW